MSAPEDRLRAVAFFGALPPAELAAVGRELTMRRARKGAVVFREGDVADAMYIVDAGRLEVVRAGKPVASLGPGSVAGELALLLAEPRSATVRALTAVSMWRLGREELDDLLAAHPAIALELSAELGRRLVTTTRRLTTSDATRVTVAVGDAAAALAVALRDAGDRVGFLALRSVAAPDGVTAIPASRVAPSTLAGLSGERFRDLDHLVVAVPRAPSPHGRAAVGTCEWVVASKDVPTWIADRHPPDRVLRVAEPIGDAVEVVARRVSGRAVALALSSGGSKTVAHIGVAAALREAGVRFDAVAGASGGALIGAAVAAHASVEVMIEQTRRVAAQLRTRKWDFHLLPRTGVMKGRRLRDLLAEMFSDRGFADLPTPFYAVASDIVTGEEVVIDRGPLAEALRASMSIPGAFDPWRFEDRLVIDGGVTNPLPVAPLRKLGYERVIASNVAGKDVDPDASAGDRLPSILGVMLRTVNLMEAEAIKAQLPLADVVVRPRVIAKSSFDFGHIDDFVEEGRAAVARQYDELRSLGFLG